MAGAEGEPGLDLDRDVVGADAGAVMGAVDQKSSGAHRLEARERIGHPVALLREAKDRGARGLLVRRRRDQRPDRLLVRLPAEIGLHQPRPAPARPALRSLERGRRDLPGLEALADQVGDRPRPPLVADEAELMRGVVGRQAFEHNPSPVYGRRWRQRAFFGTPVFRRARAPDEGKPHISRTLIRPRVPRVHLLPRAGEGLVLARRQFGSPLSRPGAPPALRAISRRNAGAMRRPHGHSPAGSATIAAKRTGRFIAPNRERKRRKPTATGRKSASATIGSNWRVGQRAMSSAHGSALLTLRCRFRAGPPVGRRPAEAHQAASRRPPSRWFRDCVGSSSAGMGAAERRRISTSTTTASGEAVNADDETQAGHGWRSPGGGVHAADGTDLVCAWRRRWAFSASMSTSCATIGAP